jgi:Zn finger protein HypA/HybF involved in hydrogenase expression
MDCLIKEMHEIDVLHSIAGDMCDYAQVNNIPRVASMQVDVSEIAVYDAMQICVNTEHVLCDRC